MAKSKPRKRKPHKRSEKPVSALTMLKEIVSRPAPVTDDAAMAAADHYDAALAALEAGDGNAAAKALHRALDSNPRDTDSLLLYAEFGRDDASDLLASLRVVEEVVRAELGEQMFIEDRGHFWGLVETRPYMRLKMRIADVLAELGENNAAIAEYEEMLSLNPNDNQGVRDVLLGLYLASGHLERADSLITEYDEASAVFKWGRVLFHLLGEDAQAAQEALERATSNNVFVAPLLLGAFEMPAAMPGMYSPGGPNEAVIAAYYLFDGWLQNDAAPLDWLAQRVTL